MGTPPAAAPPAETAAGQTGEGPPHRHQRHPVYLRTGAPWRDLPADAGVCWKTAASRFNRWTHSGAWRGILAGLQRDASQEGGIDCSRHFLDGSSVCAHQHVAGAKGTDQKTEALGRSRDGFTTKFHLRAEGGRPLMLYLSPGQRHESKLFEALMEGAAVERAGRTRPACVVADKGYSLARIRSYLARHRSAAVIPLRSDQGHDPGFDRETYPERNKVERLVGRLRQWRRIATRYDKRASNYLAMLLLASIVLWL